MRVKALQKHYYNRRDVFPGEEYEMDDREQNEAKILALLGKIDILNTEKPVVAKVVKVEESKPEPKPQPAPAEVMTTEESGLAPRRYYRRRDMKAEST